MTSSKKHHYIPQLYLKGFTNEDGEYYLFDKKTDEIRRATPISSFFENNRNTSVAGEKKHTFLEDMYAHFDSETAVELERIRCARLDNFEMAPETLHRLKSFIALMYWRVPGSDEAFEETVDLCHSRTRALTS